jgi:hypothetical protein
MEKIDENEAGIGGFIEKYINRRYIAGGIPAFECRTAEEKVEHCRRVNGCYLGIDGIILTREKACHVYRGDVVCEQCLTYRKHKRRSNYIDRLSTVKDSALSYVKVTSKKELENLTRAVKRRGHEIMAIPTVSDEDGDYGKIVFIDGYFEHSGEFGQLKRINYHDAINVAASYAELFSAQNVSGKMGKRDMKEVGGSESGGRIVVNHRRITFDTIPSHYQNSLAYAIAIKQDISANQLNKDNLQAAVEEREVRLIDAYAAIGVKARLSDKVEEREYGWDDVEARWMNIAGGTAEFSGSTDALDKFTRELIQRIVSEYESALKEVDYNRIAIDSMRKTAEAMGITEEDLLSTLA